jgi:Leucine-rich repeat (LRR) protein
MLNPRIKSLKLTKNQIRSIAVDELSLYTELQYLDLSGNEIESVQRGAFYRLSRLKVLRLGSNLLTELSPDQFVGLSSLQVLDLSDNAISRLPTAAFSDLRQLEALNLSSNRLVDIAPGAFTGLDQLAELYLSENEIKSVPQVALQNSISLRILDLSSNLISAVPNNSFLKLHLLEVLNLEGNAISKIEDMSFEGLYNLRLLNLNENQLQQVPTLSFRYLSDLEWLSINGNDFASLPTSAFEGLAALTYLSISYGPRLTAVDLNAFSGLYHLKRLRLAHNPRLRFIHRRAFESTNIPPIRDLDLSHNNLSNLNPNLIKFSELRSLNLIANPWHCDCDLTSWLYPLLTKLPHTGVLPTSETILDPLIVCVTPPKYKGRSVTDVGASTGTCDSQSGDILLVALPLSVLMFSLLSLITIVSILRRYRNPGFHSRTICCGPLFRTPKKVQLPPQSRLNDTYKVYTSGGSDRSTIVAIPEYAEKQWNCFYFMDQPLIPPFVPPPPSKYSCPTCVDGRDDSSSGHYYANPRTTIPGLPLRPASCSGTLLQNSNSSSSLDPQDETFRIVSKFPVPVTEL